MTTMAEELFSLRDAIGLYSSRIDLAHKLWAYLQVVAIGAAGFAWSAQRSAAVVGLLLAGFVIFAVGNGTLLVSTQREAVKVMAAIGAYRAKHHHEIETELLPALDAVSPWAPWRVGVLHAAIDLAAVIAIAIRL